MSENTLFDLPVVVTDPGKYPHCAVCKKPCGNSGQYGPSEPDGGQLWYCNNHGVKRWRKHIADHAPGMAELDRKRQKTAKEERDARKAKRNASKPTISEEERISARMEAWRKRGLNPHHADVKKGAHGLEVSERRGGDE